MDKKVNDNPFDILVDGIRVHIEQSGVGKPLVLIHGLGGPLMWQRVIKPLSQRFMIVNLHLPGFGESDCPPQSYSTSDYSRFVLHTLDALNLRRVIIVGTSYGGEVAVHISSSHPERIERCILINSTGLKKYWSLLGRILQWKIFSFLIRETVLRYKWLLCTLSTRSFYDPSKRPNGLCDEFYTQIMKKGKREWWLNGLRNVFLREDTITDFLVATKIPVLLIWGEYDRMVRKLQLTSLESAHIVSSIIARAGHSLPLEQPEELCKAIRGFVALGEIHTTPS